MLLLVDFVLGLLEVVCSCVEVCFKDEAARGQKSWGVRSKSRYFNVNARVWRTCILNVLEVMDLMCVTSIGLWTNRDTDCKGFHVELLLFLTTLGQLKTKGFYQTMVPLSCLHLLQLGQGKREFCGSIVLKTDVRFLIHQLVPLLPMDFSMFKHLDCSNNLDLTVSKLNIPKWRQNLLRLLTFSHLVFRGPLLQNLPDFSD